MALLALLKGYGVSGMYQRLEQWTAEVLLYGRGLADEFHDGKVFPGEPVRLNAEIPLGRGQAGVPHEFLENCG
jgi:hypothetical protein